MCSIFPLGIQSVPQVLTLIFCFLYRKQTFIIVIFAQKCLVFQFKSSVHEAVCKWCVFFCHRSSVQKCSTTYWLLVHTDTCVAVNSIQKNYQRYGITILLCCFTATNHCVQGIGFIKITCIIGSHSSNQDPLICNQRVLKHNIFNNLVQFC